MKNQISLTPENLEKIFMDLNSLLGDSKYADYLQLEGGYDLKFTPGDENTYRVKSTIFFLKGDLQTRKNTFLGVRNQLHLLTNQNLFLDSPLLTEDANSQLSAEISSHYKILTINLKLISE